MASPPLPTGANQAMLVPGPWMVSAKGDTLTPTPAFFELIRSLWSRTGGSNAVVGPGGDIGIDVLRAQLVVTTALATEALGLSEFGLAAGDDSDIGIEGLLLAQDVGVLAAGVDESPPPNLANATFLALALGDDGGAVATTATSIYAPLVNGDLPGPVLVADPLGQTIMVQIR